MTTDSHPSISILMPVRNTARYLRSCLDSILNQTETDWELICVNNQSEDHSGDILREYALKDPRIKVLENVSSDLISALRLAFENAKGIYITRMDSDDLMTTERLALMKEQLIRFGKGHVCTGRVEYFTDEGALGDGFKRYESWLNQLTKTQSNYDQIYKECVIPSPCWMVWKEDLIQCETFEPHVYPEDYDLCFRFYKYGLKVLSVNRVLLKWRDYSHRNSRTDPNYADQLFFELKLTYFLELDHNPEKELVVWGAGKKGKALVKLLQSSVPSIRWVTDSERKTGHIIYDILVQSPESLHTSCQVLVAVSNDAEQETIVQLLQNSGIEHFVFC